MRSFRSALHRGQQAERDWVNEIRSLGLSAAHGRKLVISKNRQVRQELPLCGSCLAAHKDGATLSDLYGRRSVTQAG